MYHRTVVYCFSTNHISDAAVAFGDTVEGCESKAEKDELVSVFPLLFLFNFYNTIKSKLVIFLEKSPFDSF